MNYSRDELGSLGLGGYGENVIIHKTVQFFRPERIFLGNNVRIDCFSLLSAGDDGIFIGNYVHVSAGCMYFGGGGKIQIGDFCCTSPRVTILTASDDFTEGHMTGPMIPDKYRKVKCGPVTINKHSGAGAGSVILPNVTLGVGAAPGALTLVHKDVEDFQVVLGTPMRRIGMRNRKVLELEQEFLRELETKQA